jgi:UDP-N-acetylglucosamine 2-epimerase
LISQLAQLNFAPTSLAMEHLQRSGIVGEIHHTGNTVIDALLTVAKRQPQCDISGLDWEKYRTLFSNRSPRENWGEPLRDIAQGFLQILDKFPDTAFTPATASQSHGERTTTIAFGRPPQGILNGTVGLCGIGRSDRTLLSAADRFGGIAGGSAEFG